MLAPQQTAYLQAMGIPVWTARTSATSTVQPEPQVTSSKKIANLDWPALAEQVNTCQACPLSTTRKQTVFGSGQQQADIMIIGEAPGTDEDRQGQPFVGRAGQLLTNMIRAIGLQRDQVYIANILKCQPPGNRDPKPEEVAACNAYLNRQIDLVQPRLIVSVGSISAKNLLQTEQPVSQLRGKIHHYTPTDTDLMVTYHPTYLLRRPEEKTKVWQDLQQIATHLKTTT